MGYIIGVIVLLVAIVAIAFLFSGRGPKARGRVSPAGAKPVERSEPGAEEVTPAASSTASPENVKRAQDRVIPS